VQQPNLFFQYDTEAIERGDYSQFRRKMRKKICLQAFFFIYMLFILVALILFVDWVPYSPIYLAEKIWAISDLSIVVAFYYYSLVKSLQAYCKPRNLLNEQWFENDKKVRVKLSIVLLIVCFLVIFIDALKFLLYPFNIRYRRGYPSGAEDILNTFVRLNQSVFAFYFILILYLVGKQRRARRR